MIEFEEVSEFEENRRSTKSGCIMETILESHKTLWQRTGNMALVVIGAISVFLASFEEVKL